MNTLLKNPFDQPRGKPLQTSEYSRAVADNHSLQPVFNYLGNNDNANAEISGERSRFYGFGGNPILAGQAQFNGFEPRTYNYQVGDLREQYPAIPKK